MEADIIEKVDMGPSLTTFEAIPANVKPFSAELSTIFPTFGTGLLSDEA